MKRRLFNIVTAMSLLFFVAIGPLWVRSYWIADNLESYRDRDLRSIGAISVQGTLGCAVGHFQNPPAAGTVLHGWVPMPVRPGTFFLTPGWTYVGFGILNINFPGVRATAVFVPHWFALGLSVLLPARWFRGWRRDRSARRRGLCLVCGYDLRASKERCPECGTPIPAKEMVQ